MKELKEFYIDLTVYPKAVRLAWLAEIEPLLRESAGYTVYNDNNRSAVGYIYSYGNGGYGWDDTEDGSAYGRGEQFTPEQAIKYFKGLKKEKKGFVQGDWVVSTNKKYDYAPKGSVHKLGRLDNSTYGYYLHKDCQNSLYARYGDICGDLNKFRLATKEEIQSHLIAEGLRNGVLKSGTSIKTLCGLSVTWITDCHIFHYDLVTETLLAHGAEVYSKGKWAEIVEQGIEINKYEKAISDIEKILEAIK